MAAKLQQRDREFSALRDLSESFFQVSKDGFGRLNRLVSALQAADRALQKLFCTAAVVKFQPGSLKVLFEPRIGAARADSLEVEVKELNLALHLGFQAFQGKWHGERWKDRKGEKRWWQRSTAQQSRSIGGSTSEAEAHL